MEPSIVEAKVTPSFRTVIEYIGEFATFSDLKMSIRSGVWERDFCKSISRNRINSVDLWDGFNFIYQPLLSV
jgi:uncharacterized membrane protein YdbT with pleckstrin-like domain